jgi:tyrosyl-tRNA synthetase
LTKEVPSRSEAKRLILQGGIDIDGIKVVDPSEEIEITKEGITVKIGKIKFINVVKE